MSSIPRWLTPRPPIIREFSDVEAAWLAGVIDGEGSIGIYNYGKQGRRVQVQMGNTHEGFVVRMREIVGCGSTVNREDNTDLRHMGSKPIFHYSLKGSIRCYYVLLQVLPYLIIKKQKALDIIEELERAPFGRWANCEPEARLEAAEKKRQWWAEQTPERRAEIAAKISRSRLLRAKQD